MTVSSVGLPASEIPAAALRTIWRERLILGTLNVIAGPPGAGKSSLTAFIAAELSRAGATLVISNAEDDPGSVTIPRLVAAGAILERIHVIPPDDAPLFPAEIEGLETVLRETSIRCVFLDPIGAHFRPERLVNDRPRLRQLAGVARRTGAAIVGIHHTTKNHTVGGPNSGLLGTARAVYVYGFDPEDEDRRALSCEKINGAAHPPTIVFEHEVVDVELDGGVTISAGVLRKVRESSERARSHRGRRRPERDAACLAWLTGFLAAGEDFGRHSQAVRDGARAEGFAQATLERAKVQLQAESHRRGGYGAAGAWYWVLPPEHPAREPIAADEHA
jgi:putative DNA primase/helicase